MEHSLLHLPEGVLVIAYPAEIAYAQLVSVLGRAGYRPARARALPDYPAWGAPDQYTAACPVCLTDSALVVEPWGHGDTRAVLYCTNAERCPSHTAGRTERDVHLALLTAIRRAVEVPAA
jgi:hypothetical protein